MNRPRYAALRFPLAVCAVAAAAAASCGPSGAVRAPVPASVLDDAPWEAAWDPSELVEEVTARIIQPAVPQTPEHPFDPAPDAAVELLLPKPSGALPLTSVARGTTASDGTFRLGPAPQGVFVLRARKPGFAHSLGAAGVALPGSVELGFRAVPDLGLQPAGTLRGRVADRAGRPVAGVRVLASVLAYADEARTADDGTFTVVAPLGRVVLTLREPLWEAVHRIVEFPSEDTPPVILETGPLQPYGGTVVTAEDGRPIEGAVVVSLDDRSARATTDAVGRFTLPIPRTGRIAAFAAGRGWRSHLVARAADQSIRLPVATGVSGRVVGPDGRPEGGVRIVGVAENRDGGTELVLGPLTDGEGRFDFSWMPEAPRGSPQPSAVLAWHRLRGQSAVHVLPAKGPVELRLSGWRDATGTVRDHRGRPIAGALVRANWLFEPLDETASSVLGVPRERRTFTASDGTFRVRALPRDRPVTVRAELYGLSLTKDLAPGAPEEPIPFALPEGRTLAAAVTDAAGTPVPGALVTARLLDTPGIELSRDGETGADGTARFEDLPAGRYEVVVRAPGFDLRASGDGRPGDEPVRLVVRRSADLTLRFEFAGIAEGEARPALRATIEDADAPDLPPRRLSVDPDRAELPMRIGKLDPGTWRVRAEGGVWRGGGELFTLGDGEVREVVIRLERTLRIDAVLRNSRGEPISGEPVLLVPVGGTPGQTVTVRSSDGGVVETAGLRPGQWEVRVAARDEAPLRRVVTVPLEGPLDLRLPPSGEILVRVADDSGRPLPGAIVSLTNAAGEPVYAWGDGSLQLASRFRTGEDGSARVRGVPEGRVRVAASAGGRALPEREAEVRAGAPADVRWP